MTCTAKNCYSKILAKSLCSKHYYRLKRGGTLETPKKYAKVGELCRIDSCEKIRFVNQLCSMHNKRLQRHGDPLHINPKCNRDGGGPTRAAAYRAQWKRDNWDTYKAYLATRKKRVKLATPKWADLAAIQLFYQNCPKGHHVDHIIPLNGKDRSGLHIMENLQYLPALDNLRKSNKP